MQNRNVKTLLFWIGSILIAGVLIYLIDFSDEIYREQLINGDHKMVVGKFDGVSMTAESSRLVSFKFVVNEKTYRRTIYDPSLYIQCNRNPKCNDWRFLVMYLVDDPDESLVCTIPFEGIDYLTDSLKLQEIPGFEYYGDTTILKCFE